MKKTALNSAILAAVASLAFTTYVAADHMSPMGEDWIDMPNDNHDLRMEEFEEDGDFVGDATLAMNGEAGGGYMLTDSGDTASMTQDGGASPLQNSGAISTRANQAGATITTR